jgi:hypothetical protein
VTTLAHASFSADAAVAVCPRALATLSAKRRGQADESVCQCGAGSGRSLALADLQHRGAGRRRLGLEQARERAGGHPGSDVARVAGVLEEVRVDVERDRDARVAEDAADPGYVEPEVDDQVAGEGVAQVVEAKRRPAVVV